MLAETVSDPITLPRTEGSWVPPGQVTIAASRIWTAWVDAGVVMSGTESSVDVLDSFASRLATKVVVATIIRILPSGIMTLLSGAAML
jgi:hypothetical protein